MVLLEWEIGNLWDLWESLKNQHSSNPRVPTWQKHALPTFTIEYNSPKIMLGNSAEFGARLLFPYCLNHLRTDPNAQSAGKAFPRSILQPPEMSAEEVAVEKNLNFRIASLEK